jgi:hypothetical protein
MKNIYLYNAIIVVFISCIAFAQELPQFGDRIDMGLIQSDDLVEASGIVESRNNPHVLWAHNDRNNQNRLFAFNTRGEHLGTFWIDGVENRDWEDLTIGPGPEDGVEYLYIADIGDNSSVYDIKYIYRIPEPVVDFNQDPVETSLSGVDTIAFQYPDRLQDAETMMLDPLTKDIYVVSKREFEDIRVYRAPYPQSTTETITLEHVATLVLWQVVGGDISPSGLEILLKTYTTMYYWSRTPEQNMWQAFDNDPVILPYVQEMQGEAVCWASDGMGYFTLSEENLGIPVHLFFYPRIQSLAVVINEIMQNPSAVEDVNGEWFEIYNNSTESIDLDGWTIKDSNTDLHVISQSLLISPGGYMVLGNNSDQNTNGGALVNYQYSNIVFDNSDDEILLISPDQVVVDSVVYDNGAAFPDPEGLSMALLDPNMDNGVGLNWSEATAQYGDGDFGTPGISNAAVIPAVKIRDIQYTADTSGVSPLLDQRVTVSGILSTDPFGSFFANNLFIQDSVGKWSGVLVRHTTEVAEGDSVRLTGTVGELFGGVTTLIDVSNFEILKTGVFGIDPVSVTTGEIGIGGLNVEAYEGVLVQTVGTCDNDNQDWREWSIDDGTGSVRIYHPFIGGITPIVGTLYQITGIQYYSNENYKILVLEEEGIVENPSDIEDISSTLESFILYQNHPNPFNPSTKIKFTLPKPQNVNIEVYNTIGQRVETILNQHIKAGYHEVEFNAENLSSGVYFYRIEAGEFQDVKKMVLIK